MPATIRAECMFAPPPAPDPGSVCTCIAKCDTRTISTVPFTYDGAGEFCRESISLATYINSWNADLVNINGINCANTYVSSASIQPISGVYFIYYKASYPYSHIEIK